MRRIDYIIIHHLGSSKASIEAIRQKHKTEYGWCDIGYHYIIGNGNGTVDGEVVIGRSISKGGCQSRGFNSKSISILLIGNFDIYYPSKNQWNSLVELVKKLCLEYNIPVDNVIGHRETYPLIGREPERSCPGWKFDMDRLRRELYDGDSELFSDGVRRNFINSLSVDGVIVGIEMEVIRNDFYIKAEDLKKIFDINVEYFPKLRRLEITKEGDCRGI